MKKILSLFLVLVMVFCMMSAMTITAFADPTVTLSVQPDSGRNNNVFSITLSEDPGCDWTYTIYIAANDPTVSIQYTNKSATGTTATFVGGFGPYDSSVKNYYCWVTVTLNDGNNTKIKSNTTTAENLQYQEPTDYSKLITTSDATMTVKTSSTHTVATIQSGYSITGVTATGMPEGVSVSVSNNTVILSGAPTAKGTYKPVLTITADSTHAVEKTVTVTVEPLFGITKSPTNEVVSEGGRAIFISAADKYSDVEWRVVNSDATNVWRGQSEIEAQFPGVRFSSYKAADGREYLDLSNIPLSMNGYYVQTKFWNADKSATELTDKARLTVNAAAPAAPVISKQPAGGESELGSPITLSVTATGDGTMNYQWYRNAQASTTGGTAIAGATTASYTVDQAEGTNYYYCALWVTKNGMKSDTVTTAATGVTYNAVPEATPEPTEAPAVTEAPAEDPAVTEAPSGSGNGDVSVTTQTPAPTEAPAVPATPAPDGGKTGKTDNLLLMIVAGLLILVVACIAVIYAKVRSSGSRGGRHNYRR